jgi:rare lipoprotein A (peptidoglycan hydrolase)
MLDLSYAAAQELDMVEAGTAPVHIEVVGNHRVVSPVPPGTLSSIAGMLLSTDARPIQHRNGPDKRVEMLMAPFRIMSQDALYVRRERRVASTLPVDHKAHDFVPTFLVT